MGKVVKSARIVEQKYVVGVPQLDAPGAPHARPGDADAQFTASFAPAPSINGAMYEEPEIAASADTFVAPQPQVDWEALKADAEAIVDRAASDAESLLRQAESTALELVERARTQAAQIEDDARKRGYDAGHDEGNERAIGELNPVIATFRELIEAIHAQRDDVIAGAEPELVRLAMAIAERIVHTEVENNRNVVVENVRSALTRLVTREVVTLRVNPIDHETIRQYRDAIVAASDVEHLRIVEDQRVDRGGVVVETDSGTIDAKISTQLREAKRAILTEEAIALDSSPAESELLHPSAHVS